MNLDFFLLHFYDAVSRQATTMYKKSAGLQLYTGTQQGYDYFLALHSDMRVFLLTLKLLFCLQVQHLRP